MEVSELTLWIARLLVLALMYGVLLALIVALLADARAAAAPRPTTVGVSAPAQMAPAAPPVLTLEVVSGSLPSSGREYHLLTPVEIGRVGSCEICIPNRFVSTRHARITPQDGGWVVEDLGSTNGTLINGAPLTASHRLVAGDRLLIGDTELVVK